MGPTVLAARKGLVRGLSSGEIRTMVRRWSRVDIVLVLGRGDRPTDGVGEYCCRLQEACRRRGWIVEILQLDWEEQGWWQTVTNCLRYVKRRRPSWSLLQFTHLMWSKRGVAAGALLVNEVLRRNVGNTGLFLHDPAPFRGLRIRDRARQRAQSGTLNMLLRYSDVAFTTVQPDRLPWISTETSRASIHYLPVGSNIPVIGSGRVQSAVRFTIAVFGITEGPAAARELTAIATAVKKFEEAGKRRARVVIFGRGSDSPETHALGRHFDSDVEVRGIISEDEVSQILSSSSVLLYVRDGASSRHGTVVAAIVHGLPIVAYRGEETGLALMEAGTLTTPLGDAESLGDLLAEIHDEPEMRDRLRSENQSATEKYFSWEQIAESLCEVLCLR